LFAPVSGADFSRRYEEIMTYYEEIMAYFENNISRRGDRDFTNAHRVFEDSRSKKSAGTEVCIISED
jgi:hypothetical protein